MYFPYIMYFGHDSLRVEWSSSILNMGYSNPQSMLRDHCHPVCLITRKNSAFLCFVQINLSARTSAPGHKPTFFFMFEILLRGQNQFLPFVKLNNHRGAPLDIKSLRPTDANMRLQPRPPLLHIMACCLFGAKPLYQPMLAYCQLDPWEQTSVKFSSRFKHFHWTKCIWKCPENVGDFVSASMC